MYTTRADDEPSAVWEDRVEAYCVKCRAKRDMSDPKQVTMKNGKPAVQGKCPECGTGLYKIGASVAAT